jgi:hypothetical protein
MYTRERGFNTHMRGFKRHIYHRERRLNTHREGVRERRLNTHRKGLERGGIIHIERGFNTHHHRGDVPRRDRAGYRGPRKNCSRACIMWECREGMYYNIILCIVVLSHFII